jgi:hypothetical protein
MRIGIIMKKISWVAVLIIGIVSIFISVTYMTFSTYRLEKMKLENQEILNTNAIKAGMIQIPVNICTESHQELKWVRNTEYNIEDGREVM